MVSIKDLINIGFRCPNCSSQEIRAGYHDWQVLDSFICKSCGYRWIEDTGIGNNLILFSIAKGHEKDRNIWVLHTANHPNEPLKNSKSADEVTRKKFLEEAYSDNNPSRR